MSVGCFLGAFLMWPRDVFLTYRAVAQTGAIGPNLKALAMLMLPIPLLLWPIMVFLIAAMWGLAYPAGVAAAATFDDAEFLLVGGCLYSTGGAGNPREHGKAVCLPTIKDAFLFVKDFWDFNAHSLFGFAEELRHERPRDGQRPLDINVCALLGYFLMVIFNAVIMITVVSVFFLLKGPPILLLAYIRGAISVVEGLRNPDIACGCKDMLAFFSVWVVGLTGVILAVALWPPFWACGGVLSIVGFGMSAVSCGVIAYKYGFPSGWLQLFNLIRAADCGSNAMIGGLLGMKETGRDPSCLPEFDVERHRPCCGRFSAVQVEPAQVQVQSIDGRLDEPIQPSQPPLQRSASSFRGTTAALVEVDQVWDNFFAQCQAACKDGLRTGQLKLADLESLEPSVILGVPACVILQAVKRSLNPPADAPPVGPDDWLMADGVVISATNRPRGMLADKLFEPVLKVKRAFVQARPDEALWQKLHEAALRQDGAFLDGCSGNPSPGELLAGLNRISVLLSRAPTFHRRFNTVIRRVIRTGAVDIAPDTIGHVLS